MSTTTRTFAEGPHRDHDFMAKKISAKKKASRTAPASMPAKPQAKPQAEVDPRKLDPEDAKKRCAATYKLDREVEKKRIKYDAAKKAAAAAKTELIEAEEARDKELHDQRFGPGPLFAPDGIVNTGAPRAPDGSTEWERGDAP